MPNWQRKRAKQIWKALKLRENIWLALTIGNSRLHWAWFMGKTLCDTWDTEYLPDVVVEQLSQPWGAGDWHEQIFPPSLLKELESIKYTVGDRFHYRDRPLPLYLASVVPQQTAIWQSYPSMRLVTLEQLLLKGVYPTLGIDRALAVLGAGITWGWPILVIDAGTALTFTGADATRQLIGGAILPGLGLQLQSLAQKTAQLPAVNLPSQLPPRFALNTQDAIESGVIYTIVAGIRDFIQAWWEMFPESRIILTGGDRTFLLTYLQTLFPEIASKVSIDPNLIFWAMRSLVKEISDFRFQISN